MAGPDRAVVLATGDLARAVAELDGWRIDGDHLRRTFEFGSFVVAFGFMASVALVAERLNHHPEWFNVYGRVDIAVTNHDAGGLTEIDLEFCRRVDTIAGGTHA